MTGTPTPVRLCDDAGMVSDEPVVPGSPGTEFTPGLTYRGLLNNLRAHTGLSPYEGPPFQCTGSVHLAGEHIVCASPVHQPDGILGSLPPGVTATFTWTCPFGCTVHVVDGNEQPHECAGEATILKVLLVTPGIKPPGAPRTEHVIAEALKPLIREQLFDSWKDGVLSGRRGLCYGVDDDIPDGSAGEVPPTLAAVPEAEPAPQDQPLIGHLTTDRNDPRLTYGVDAEPTPQAAAYLVAGEETPQEFVRPVRTAYRHNVCGVVTTMNQTIAETYARDPKFYGATYCVGCAMHLPVDEFDWEPAPSEGGSVPPEQRVVGS